MDISSVASTIASSTSQDGITNSLIRGTENLAAVQATILFQSIGLGNSVDVHA
jgi:hypothetical protein